jgi:hypothetical protein
VGQTNLPKAAVSEFLDFIVVALSARHQLSPCVLREKAGQFD